MLSDVDEELRDTLSQFSYQSNRAVLHWDREILPKERFWSAWNYRSSLRSDEHNEQAQRVSVTYLINKLQKLPVDSPVLVTLNPVSEIDPKKIWKEIQYEHPVFDADAVRAQGLLMPLQGRDHLYFSGAWLRYGFHEDGILSAKRVINEFLRKNDDEDRMIEVYE